MNSTDTPPPTGGRNGIYSPGERVAVVADLAPASVVPWPDGVPRGRRLRAIITERSLTFAWSAGTDGREPIIARVDIPVDTPTAVTYQGGQLGGYTVRRAASCSCGMSGVKNFHPFPDTVIVQATRYATPYGVPPVREPMPQRYRRARTRT